MCSLEVIDTFAKGLVELANLSVLPHRYSRWHNVAFGLCGPIC